MSGNVWEWCSDYYGPYNESVDFDPAGPSEGTERVIRGGGWSSDPIDCRVTARYKCPSGNHYGDQGLRLVCPEYVSDAYNVNGVKFFMLPVTEGIVSLGQIGNQPTGVNDVKVNTFMIGETEVSQALWTAVMGDNPSFFKGNDLPVENVSLTDCLTFIKRLNDLTGENFRLPTEAEWEFAAKGGSFGQGSKYSGGDKINEFVWYNINSKEKSHGLTYKRPNEIGVYGMSGNVWEVCSDPYDAVNDKTSNTGYVVRGGGWSSPKEECEVTSRYEYYPESITPTIGFRLAK